MLGIRRLEPITGYLATTNFSCLRFLDKVSFQPPLNIICVQKLWIFYFIESSPLPVPSFLSGHLQVTLVPSSGPQV